MLPKTKYKELPEYITLSKSLPKDLVNVILSYLTEVKKNYYIGSMVKYEETYVNGKLHGDKYLYDVLGNIRCYAIFINNEMRGNVVYYDKNGDIIKSHHFINGKMIF
jgi:antitoxin component YwqK of YwqJK toxin-antitoxin module